MITQNYRVTLLPYDIYNFCEEHQEQFVLRIDIESFKMGTLDKNIIRIRSLKLMIHERKEREKGGGIRIPYRVPAQQRVMMKPFGK